MCFFYFSQGVYHMIRIFKPSSTHHSNYLLSVCRLYQFPDIIVFANDIAVALPTTGNKAAAAVFESAVGLEISTLGTGKELKVPLKYRCFLIDPPFIF